MLITENLHGVTAIEIEDIHYETFVEQKFKFAFSNGDKKEVSILSYMGNTLPITRLPDRIANRPANPKPLDTALQP